MNRGLVFKNGALALVVALGACSLGWSQNVAAQSTPAGEADTGNGYSLGEIVVTARRRSESAQTVPVSVSVINAETMAKQGLQTTEDLQRLVPGVVFNAEGPATDSTYFIRGQGKGVTGPGLLSVVTYLNDVPLLALGAYVPLFDIDNVQVLKGPQGTLFGRNTTGGAVLQYSTAPTHEFGGYAQADFGNYSKHSFQGAINLPLVQDVLAIRVAADIDRRDGYTKNISTGQDLDDVHMNAVRVSLLAQPISSIKNITVFDYTAINNNGVGILPFEAFTPTGEQALVAAQALGPRTVATRFRTGEQDKLTGVSNTTTIDLGSVSLKNVFGYRNVHTAFQTNADGVVNAPLPDIGLGSLGVVPGQPGVLLTVPDTLLTRQQYTDELQLSGTSLHDNLTWLVGGFYLHATPPGPNSQPVDLFRPTPPTATTSFIVNNFLGGIWPVGSLSDTLYSDLSRAVFGNVGYDLGGLSEALTGLKLNAGYRYTWDKEGVCSAGRSVTSLATGLPLASFFQSDAECEAYSKSFSSSASFSHGTYTLGLDYKVNNDVFVYLTTRSGYRSGGLNTPTLPPILAGFQTYQPQTLKDYELGTHTQWSAGGWQGRFNLAAFRSRISNLQLQATGIQQGGSIPGLTAENTPTNTGLQVNAGTETVQGIELDGLVSPFKALDITYGLSYLSARLTDVSVAPILAPYLTPGNFAATPKWSFQTAVQYRLPLRADVGEVAVEGNYYYIGPQYQQNYLEPGYSLTNFRVNWTKVFGEPVDLTFYVDNALDKTYVINTLIGVGGFGLYSGGLNPPRMYGVRARYNF